MTAKLLKDKYRLLEKIDEDEKVVLFLGQTVSDPVMNVDIRVLKRRFMNPEFVRRYTEEFQAMSSLDSAQFMKVYDIDFFNNLYFVATEHVEGKSIRSLMENRERLSLAQVINAVTQVARALGHAFKENLKYRALTYSDIVLTENGKIKILQFRIPRNVTSNPESHGNVQSVSADIFFAGCLFYELLTLEGINVKNSALPRIKSIRDFYFDPDGAKLKPSQIESIKTLIYKCITGEIAARYQSIDELLAGLVQFVQEQVNTTDVLTSMQVEPSKFIKKDKNQSARETKTPVILPGGLHSAQGADAAPAPQQNQGRLSVSNFNANAAPADLEEGRAGDPYDILFGKAPAASSTGPAKKASQTSAKSAGPRDLRAVSKSHLKAASPAPADGTNEGRRDDEAPPDKMSEDESSTADFPVDAAASNSANDESVTVWRNKKSQTGGLLAKMANFWYTTLFMLIGVLSFVLYIFW